MARHRQAGDRCRHGRDRPSREHRRPRRAGDTALEDLWIRDVTITTGLVDTYSTPTLVQLLQGHQIDAGRFVTQRFQLAEFLDAYDIFARAGETGALKVALARSVKPE